MKFIKIILLISFCSAACSPAKNTDAGNRIVGDEKIASIASPGSNSQTIRKNDNAYGEITNCNPEKLTRGTTLVIGTKTPNGGYLAIEREDRKRADFYLLSAPQSDDSDDLKDAFPFWQTETLKTLSRIELNTAEVRAVNLSKLGDKGKAPAEPVFNRTGWYKILLSDENFEQDEPVITGRCRVYFDASQPAPKTSSPNESSQSKTINWETDVEDMHFETRLAVEKDRPTAFSLSGYRTIKLKDSETAHECGFGVENGDNKSVWKTANNKTAISGKDDSGNDFQMYIEKKGEDFLIDTSAAAESCFNVGMPGNILLFQKDGNFSGRFIATK